MAPIDPPEQAPPGVFSLSTAKTPAPLVLVVDDEPLVRWSVAETLGAAGYEIVEAGDGRSALQAIRDARSPVDLVMLDLRLPDVADLSLFIAMHRLWPNTQIVIMTAYSSPEMVTEARALGAFAVINKPFELADLALLVERALTATRPS